MRINVYTEELTADVQVVEKQGEGRTFHGLRFYLKSPEDLHHRADDDDRSAVTFWGLSAVLPLFKAAVALLESHHAKGVTP